MQTKNNPAERDVNMAELRAAARKLGIKPGNCTKASLISMINDRISSRKAIDGICAAIDSAGGEYTRENSMMPDDGLTDDTLITVRSMTSGTLIYKPEKGKAVVWSGIGTVKELTLAQITEMNDRSPGFLHAPLVILLDDRAAARFSLTKLYERISSVSDLSSLFSKDKEIISEQLDRAIEANMRDILISRTRTMYKNKTLTDINVIRLLEKKLSFELSDESAAEDIQ